MPVVGCNNVIDLTDPAYFCNRSWTVSFNLNTNSWVSFHSYLPNYYIGENNFFYSGVNGLCGFNAVAGPIIPTPLTTTTTTSIPDITTTTTTDYPFRTTTSTSTSSTTSTTTTFNGTSSTSTSTSSTSTSSTSTSTSTSSSTTTTTTTLCPTCGSYMISNDSDCAQKVTLPLCDGSTIDASLESGETIMICLCTDPTVPVDVTFTLISPTCSNCLCYQFTNTTSSDQIITYAQCLTGNTESDTIPAGKFIYRCCVYGSLIIPQGVTYTYGSTCDGSYLCDPCFQTTSTTSSTSSTSTSTSTTSTSSTSTSTSTSTSSSTSTSTTSTSTTRPTTSTTSTSTTRATTSTTSTSTTRPTTSTTSTSTTRPTTSTTTSSTTRPTTSTSTTRRTTSTSTTRPTTSTSTTRLTTSTSTTRPTTSTSTTRITTSTSTTRPTTSTSTTRITTSTSTTRRTTTTSTTRLTTSTSTTIIANCNCYLITTDLESAGFTYTSCAGTTLIGNVTFTNPANICALPGTISGSSITIILRGPCSAGCPPLTTSTTTKRPVTTTSTSTTIPVGPCEAKSWINTALPGTGFQTVTFRPCGSSTFTTIFLSPGQISNVECYVIGTVTTGPDIAVYSGPTSCLV